MKNRIILTQGRKTTNNDWINVALENFSESNQDEYVGNTGTNGRVRYLEKLDFIDVDPDEWIKSS